MPIEDIIHLFEKENNPVDTGLNQRTEPKIKPGVMALFEKEVPQGAASSTAPTLPHTMNVSIANELGRSPEGEAQAYKASKAMNLPIGVTRELPPGQFSPTPTLSDSSPALEKYLAQSVSNATISKNDQKKMADVESIWTKIKKSYVLGSRNVQLGRLRAQEIYGDESPELQERIDLIRADMNPPQPDENFLETVLTGAAEQLPLLGAGLIRAQAEGTRGAIVFGTGTAIAGQLGPQAGLPEEIITVPVAATIGFGLGAAKGASQSIFEIEAGLAYDEFLDIRDEAGQPIDKNVLKAAATGVGLINASLEFVSLGKLLETIPGGEKLIGKMTTGAVKQMLKNTAVRQSLAQIAGRFVGAVGTEAVTEMAQETVTILASEFSKLQAEHAEGQEFAPTDTVEATNRIIGAGYEALAATIGLGLPGSVVNIARVTTKANNSIDFQEKFSEVNEAVNSTATKGLSPDHIELFMENMSGASDDIFITPEGVLTLFQEDPKAAGELFEKIGVDPAEAQADANRGHNIAVKQSKIHAQLSTEEVELIKPDIKPAPSAYSLREILNNDVTEDINEIRRQAEEVAELETQAQTELDRIKSQIKDAGFEEDFATETSQLYDNFAVRMGFEGQDKVDFFEKIEVRTAKAPDIQRAPIVDNQFTQGQTFNQAGQIVTDTPAFKKFFGESKVVDESGKPLVVFHGTDQEFEAFEKGDIGFHFGTQDQAIDRTDEIKDAKVIEAYLSLKNPYDISSDLGDWSDMGMLGEFLAEANDGPFTDIEFAEFKNVDDVKKGLQAKGFDGIKYFNNFEGEIRQQQAYIAFEPTQIKSTSNRGTFDPSDPRILFQPTKEGQPPRGAVTFTPEKTIVSLFENQDLSTVIHETAHIFLNEMNDIVAQGAAPEDVVNDLNIIREWLGWQEGQNFTAEQQEQFARGFEAYLLEGKAPTVALEAAFARFRRWLMQVYRSVKDLDVKLTKNVRGVFDRMFTAGLEAESAAAVNGVVAKTTDELNALGVISEDQAFMKRLIKEALRKAEESLVKNRNRSYRRNIKTWTAEAEAEVNANPVYKDIDALVEGFGISREEFIILYGEENIKNLSNPKVLRKDGPLIDTQAFILGYDSGDHLVNALVETPPKQQATDDLIAQKAANDAALFRPDDFLVSTKEYGDYLAILAKYLDGSAIKAEAETIDPKTTTGKPKPAKTISRQAFRQFAKRTLREKSVREAIRVDKYMAAMKKASNAERSATLAGNFGIAAKANEKVRLNYELARQATRHRENVNKILNRAVRAGKSSGIDVEYRENIRALIDRFKMGNLVPQKPLEMTPLSKLIAPDPDNYVDGFPASDFLLNNISNDYKDLSVNQFEEIGQLVDFLAGQGRAELRDLLSDRQTSLIDTVNQITQETATLKDKTVHTKFSAIRKLTDKVRVGLALLDSFQFVAIALGGYQNIGAKGVKSFAEHAMVDPLIDAANEETIKYGNIQEMLQPHIVQLQKATKRLEAEHGRKMRIEGAIVPEILQEDGQVGWWTPNQVFSIALNMGNEGNLERLLRGYPDLTIESVNNIVSVLEKRDWDAIQGIWDTIDSLYPETAAVHLRLNNFHMNKVEATPVTTRHGRYKGGYYPAKFDPHLSLKVAEFTEADELFSSQEAVRQVPATRSGYTKVRVAGVALPLKLDTSVATEHIRDVVHYTTHAEAIKDVDRIVRNEGFAHEATRAMGKQVYDNLRPALKHIARPHFKESFSPAVEWTRNKTTAFFLAYNLQVALKQPFSVFGAIHDTGVTPFAHGLAKVVKEPFGAIEEMEELSPYMRQRRGSFDRELRRGFSKLTGDQKFVMFGDRAVSWKEVQDVGFTPIRIADMMTVTPIWHGAFSAELSRNGSDVQAAVLFADDKVRKSQPSAQALDLTAFQRLGGVHRLFSSFTTFTVGKFGQRQRLHYRAWKQNRLTTGQYAYFNLLDWLLPGLAMSTLLAVLKGEDLSEEEAQVELLKETAKYGLIGVPLLGQVVSNYGDPLDSPLSEGGKHVGNFFKHGFKYLDRQKDKDLEKIYWDLAHIISFGAGVPASRFVDKAIRGSEQQQENIPGVKFIIPAPKKR